MTESTNLAGKKYNLNGPIFPPASADTICSIAAPPKQYGVKLKWSFSGTRN